MGIVYMNINTNTVKGCVVYVQIMSFGGIIQKGFDIVPSTYSFYMWQQFLFRTSKFK